MGRTGINKNSQIGNISVESAYFVAKFKNRNFLLHNMRNTNTITQLLFGGGIALLLSCNLKRVDDDVSEPLPNFEKHFVFENNRTVIVESVVEANDGGYVISGYTSDQNFLFNNLFMVKTSITGSVEKKVTDFGTFNSTSGGQMIKVNDGYIIIGSEYTGDDNQVLVCKMRTDLTRAWTKSFGKTDRSEVAGDLLQAATGDIIVAATKGIPGDMDDPFFLKVRASDGMLLDSQTINIVNNGRFSPKSIARNGNLIGVLGYNFGISIPFPFFMKIDQDFSALVPYKSLSSIGNGTGVIVQGTGDGFVRIDGSSTQLVRQAYIESLDGNGEQTARFDQFSEISNTGFLGGARTSNGKYVGCGWAADENFAERWGIAALLTNTLGTEETYQYSQLGKAVELTAANTVSDGGFILAGIYDNGKEILLIKLNDRFKLN